MENACVISLKLTNMSSIWKWMTCYQSENGKLVWYIEVHFLQLVCLNLHGFLYDFDIFVNSYDSNVQFGNLLKCQIHFIFDLHSLLNYSTFLEWLLPADCNFGYSFSQNIPLAYRWKNHYLNIEWLSAGACCKLMQVYNHAYRHAVHIYAQSLVFLSPHAISAYWRFVQ